jgi:hypothetical protein
LGALDELRIKSSIGPINEAVSLLRSRTGMIAAARLRAAATDASDANFVARMLTSTLSRSLRIAVVPAKARW